ncbi:protein of unknown function DUF2428 death-receptor-like [Trinorchestia longiramus]|nr:protein of unknown function DUF2428 death-receptor-like [Trinorchestia longiramus]
MERKSDIQSLCVKVQTLLKFNYDCKLASSRQKAISTIRGVYEAVQSFPRYSLPKVTPEENHQLTSLLLCVVVAEQLPYDASVLASSSIVLLLPFVHNELIDMYFSRFYQHISRDHFKDGITFPPTLEIQGTICLCCGPAQPRSASVQGLLAFFHGFLKSSPDWMFKRCSAISVFNIMPHLVNLVGSVDTTWLYQLFIIFDLWCAKVKKNLASILDASNDEGTTHDAVELLLEVCSLHQNRPGSLFKILSMHWECPVKGVPGLCISILSNMISIFDGITSVPPSPSAPQPSRASPSPSASSPPAPQPARASPSPSVSPPPCASPSSSAAQSQRALPPSASPSSGADIVLRTVISSGLWSSRASYASLQSLLLGHHLTAQQLLERCGKELCEGMCSGLRSSHLATCVTAFYRLILPELTVKLWLCYFLEGFVASLTSNNRTTQHNVMTLWLPVTLQRHPSLWQQLLEACPDTDCGWRAKMAVLRSAPSALSPHILCLEQACTMVTKGTDSTHNEQFKEENTLSMSELMINLSINVQSHVRNESPLSSHHTSVLCPVTVWKQALDHPLPAVRADALDLLCTLPKGSFISEPQAKLIQDFFLFNINIDCSIFRLSVVKSFRHLITRLRDSICKCTIPFKKELEQDRKIPCHRVGTELMVSSKLVVWFVHFLHHELENDGNYQRKILSLQLYKEVILSFSNRACKNKNGNNIAIERAVKFMDFHFAESEYVTQEHMFWTSDLIGPSYRSHHANSCLSKVLCFSGSDCDGKNFRKDPLQISNLTLPNTIPLIISHLKHEMNDVKDESEELLSILSEKTWLLYVHNECSSKCNTSENDLFSHTLDVSNEQYFKPCFTSPDAAFSMEPLTSEYPSGCNCTSVLSKLLIEAIVLLDCPKMSLAESGGIILRAVVAAVRRLQCVPGVKLRKRFLHWNLRAATRTSICDTDDTSLHLLRVLLAKAQRDLAQARRSLLGAAHNAPIYGTVLALAAVLGNVSISTSSIRRAYEAFLPQVLLFCEEAVSFMLGAMALAAKEEGAVAPSFSEISESIERIVNGTQNRSQKVEDERASPDDCDGDGDSDACASDDDDDNGDDDDDDDDDDDEKCGAISDSHQLVLSCCWQTIRAACVLSSTVLCSPLVCVSATPAPRILSTSSAHNTVGYTITGAVSVLDSSNFSTVSDVAKVATSITDSNADNDVASDAANDVDSDAANDVASDAANDVASDAASDIDSDAAHPTDSVHTGEEAATPVCLSTVVVRRAVDTVLIRTLTGTRHKGAIEAAKVCLSDTARVMLKRSASSRILAKLVNLTLSRELDLSGYNSSSHRRSVTRRAAGLAMLTQAVCVADYTAAERGAEPTLLLRTLDTLLQHASHDQQENELGDCRCSVVLHLLQGVVQQLQHCPRLDAIAAACISAFTSTCWRCRNAGLQLFGSVVSRLVGQKKVSQDSSEYNSVTAPQFIAAHLELAYSMLDLLRSAARAVAMQSGNSCWSDSTCLDDRKLSPQQCNDDDDKRESLSQLANYLCSESKVEKIALQKCNGDIPPQHRGRTEVMDDLANEAGHSDKSEIELSSAVIPVLCLLSRLSPGLQLSIDIFADITVEFQKYLCNLLASSIVNIRSLAAVSLLSLTPQAEVKTLISKFLDRLSNATSSFFEESSEVSKKPSNTVKNDHFVATNERHGLLLVVKEYIERSIKMASLENADALPTRRTLAALYSNVNECYVIRALACECLLLLNDNKSLNIDKRSSSGGRNHSPGYERYVELSLVYLLRSAWTTRRIWDVSSYLYGSSYKNAETAANFWIENNLQMKDRYIDHDNGYLVPSIICSVLSNEMFDRSGLFLKIIDSFFEIKVPPRCLFAGIFGKVACTDSLLLILRGGLDASAQRSLLILISHLLHSTDYQLSDNLLHAFSENVVKFSGESCSEALRLCSAKCAGLVLPLLLADVNVRGLRYLKEHIAQVVCDLLYDEDSSVRDTAASEIFSVLSSSQKHLQHSNKTLVNLMRLFTQQCILKNDSVLLESVWTCFVDCAGKNANFKAKTKNCFNGNLFESDALNLYKENHLIAQMLERHLLTAALDPCCARLILRLCSAAQFRVASTPGENASEFSLQSRLHRFHAEVLRNIGNSTVQA